MSRPAWLTHMEASGSVPGLRGRRSASLLQPRRTRVPSRRYVLISPCRDEAMYMRRTLESVMAQSVPPALWIVVDDGSTDATPQILESYASRMPYLKVVRRANRG